MKKIALLSLALFACNSDEDGCNGHRGEAESKDTHNVEVQQKKYQTNQPVPMFEWSQDRDNLIQIYKMKNESRATHSVVRSAGTGEILWDCPSVGFPLPADTQLTNPLQVMSVPWLNGGYVVEQAEPNGLFSSKNTDGTYVICTLADGSMSPQYTEEKVEVFTRPIKVDGGKVVFLEGQPTMTIEKKK